MKLAVAPLIGLGVGIDVGAALGSYGEGIATELGRYMAYQALDECLNQGKPAP